MKLDIGKEATDAIVRKSAKRLIELLEDNYVKKGATNNMLLLNQLIEVVEKANNEPA